MAPPHLFLDKDTLVSTTLLTKEKRKTRRKMTSSPHLVLGARGPATHAAQDPVPTRSQGALQLGSWTTT
jgi:hypothetical protein